MILLDSGTNHQATRITEENTFDVLRRVPYWQACAEYTIAALTLPSDAPKEDIRMVVDPVLKPLGWTLTGLEEYFNKDYED